jgi:hypothetical protein
MDINQEIKNRIHEKFPALEISIYPDETQDNIIVAIDDEIYYNDDYLELIMDIKMNILWKNNILNYLFVKETVKPGFIPVSVLLTNIRVPVTFYSFNNNATTEAISFSKTNYSDSLSDGDRLWPMAA